MRIHFNGRIGFLRTLQPQDIVPNDRIRLLHTLQRQERVHNDRIRFVKTLQQQDKIHPHTPKRPVKRTASQNREAVPRRTRI